MILESPSNFLPGRTGRIGYKGTASSFYCDRDEPIASVLTRTLLETKQEIPDFLEPYKPEGEAAVNLKFEEDSDFEEEGNAADEVEGGGWGGGDDEANGDGEEATDTGGW